MVGLHILAVILLILAVVCFVVWGFTDMSVFGALGTALTGGFVLAAVGIVDVNESKPTIIETAIPMQIDTTIFIQNGIADTTYTYHF